MARTSGGNLHPNYFPKVRVSVKRLRGKSVKENDLRTMYVLIKISIKSLDTFKINMCVFTKDDPYNSFFFGPEPFFFFFFTEHPVHLTQKRDAVLDPSS